MSRNTKTTIIGILACVAIFAAIFGPIAWDVVQTNREIKERRETPISERAEQWAIDDAQKAIDEAQAALDKLRK